MSRDLMEYREVRLDIHYRIAILYQSSSGVSAICAVIREAVHLLHAPDDTPYYPYRAIVESNDPFY